MAKVSLRNVTKTHRSDRDGLCPEIRDFNLEIDDHECVVLAGPPGCGSSMILRMIAGLEEMSGGEILLGDRRVNDLAPKDRDMAMVLPKHVLYPHMSVYDNMALGLKVRKTASGEIKKRIDEAATTFGLHGLLERKAASLSVVERQRVAVGCAIARQPKALLFDEPFSGLDAGMRAQMRVELMQLHQNLRVTTVHAARDPMEAMAAGARVVVMSGGEIQQVDTPLKLYREPKNLFAAAFFGSPSMNFIHGTLRNAGGGLIFKEENQGTIELAVEAGIGAASFIDREVILGIRPEDCPVLPIGGLSAGKTFRALVDLVEPLGGDTLFHLQTGAHRLISRSTGFIDPATAGHRIQFSLAADRLHFFDPATTERIV